MGYYYYDIYYIILVLPMVIFSLIASVKVKSTFNKYSCVRSIRGLTGAQAASEVLRFYGINDVKIEHVSGELTDHYDPKANVIRLSDKVYNSTSVASIGVACHEAGHAAQYAQGYVPVKLRSVIYPACSIGSKIGIPIAIIGLIFSFDFLITIGIAFFGLAVFFQIVTLPVEFNASRRAVKVIDEMGILQTEELKGTKKVLTAAALTYVASLAVSVANLLRLILLTNRRRR
ncbi:MAG: zinc metallopeptidase [Oscillospiraceae bacterium]|nr:zinc metallopeptidase [Oscillospiraceae bacterium]